MLFEAAIAAAAAYLLLRPSRAEASEPVSGVHRVKANDPNVQAIAAWQRATSPGRNDRDAGRVSLVNRSIAWAAAHAILTREGFSSHAASVIASHYGTQQLKAVYWGNWQGNELGKADLPYWEGTAASGAGGVRKLRAYSSWHQSVSAFMARLGKPFEAWLRGPEPASLSVTRRADAFVEKMIAINYYGKTRAGNPVWVAGRKAKQVAFMRQFAVVNGLEKP